MRFAAKSPRFMSSEKADLWIGVVLVVLGAAAMMVVCAAAFDGTPGAENFANNAGGIAFRLAAHVGPAMGTLFAN